MKVISQRKQYLDQLKRETRKFWVQVVEDYNDGVPVPEISQKYVNKRTGKPYSRQQIYKIIKAMRDDH